MPSVELTLPTKMKKERFMQMVRDLKGLGWTYDEISGLFKVSKTTVFKALKGRTNSRNS